MNVRVQVGGRYFIKIFPMYHSTRRRIPENGKLHIRMCNNTMKKDMDGDYDGLTVKMTILLFLKTNTLF
jgi:hypothetical protein